MESTTSLAESSNVLSDPTLGALSEFSENEENFERIEEFDVAPCDTSLSSHRIDGFVVVLVVVVSVVSVVSVVDFRTVRLIGIIGMFVVANR